MYTNIKNGEENVTSKKNQKMSILFIVGSLMVIGVVAFGHSKNGGIMGVDNKEFAVGTQSVDSEISQKLKYARDSMQVEKDITGGAQVTPNSIPFIASIQIKSNGFHFCTGSIVGPRNVLTAAHCCENKIASDIRVVAGEHTINTVEPNTEQIVDVTVIDMHSGYTAATLANDVCLLQLATTLSYNNAVQQAILPLQNQAAPPQGTSVTAAGWGNSQLGTAGSNVLQSVEIKVQTDATCQSQYGNFFQAHMICATDPGQGICEGDSGGPLYLGNKQVIGVSSFVSSAGCGHGQYASAFAEVSYFVDWIVARLAPLECEQTVTASVVTNGKTYFVIQPPSSGSVNTLTLNTCGSQIDPWLYVYNGAGTTTSNAIWNCDDCGPCGWRTVQSFSTNGGSPGLSKGTKYTVGVGAYSTGAGTFTMTMTCGSADLACGATATGSITAYGLQYYTLSIPQGKTKITLNTCPSSYDTWLYLYEGESQVYSCDDCGHTTCGGTVLYRTVQDFQVDGLTSTLPALEPGYTYQVAVGGFSSSSGNIHMTVSCV